ncbi:MAG: hypothetical protein R3C53_27325 [Pirellulaceae bacterium]
MAATGADDFFHFQEGLNFGGSEAGGFSVIASNLGAGVLFKDDVAVDKDFSLLGTDITTHELVLFDGTITGQTASFDAKWPFECGINRQC